MKKALKITVYWAGLSGFEKKIGDFNASIIMTGKLQNIPGLSVDVWDEVDVETIDTPEEIRKTIDLSNKTLFGFYLFRGFKNA